MPIDLIFIIAFGLGFRHGYTQGIISTVFNVLAYVFGVVLAFKVTPLTTGILERMFNSQNPTIFIAAFLVNISLIMFMLRAAAGAFEKGLQAVYLGFINRALGGAIMATLAILIYSILLWFAVKVHLVNETTIAESRSYPLLEKMPSAAKQVAMRLRPFAEEAWDTSIGWMDRLDKFGGQKTGTQPKVYEPADKGTGIEEEPEKPASQPFSPPPSDEDGIEE
jgi:membrane protein required for colicin V production